MNEFIERWGCASDEAKMLERQQKGRAHCTIISKGEYVFSEKGLHRKNRKIDGRKPRDENYKGSEYMEYLKQNANT
jgi:hypothetical protein